MAGEAIETSHPAEPQGSAVQTPAAAPAAENTNFYDNWGLTDEQVGFIQTKGLKTPADIMKSYMEAQSFVGMDKNTLIKVPKADADGNVDYSEVYKALGMPEKPEDYELEGDMAKDFMPELHKAGLSKTQAKQLYDAFNTYMDGLKTSFQSDVQKNYASQIDSLKRDWGKDFDNNVQLGNEAFASLAKELNLKDDDLPKIASVIGADKVAKLMLKLAGNKDEGLHNLTNYSAGHETKEMASYKLKEMQRDPETAKKILAHDAKTIEEMNRLTKITMEA